jgi:hypothetical protein
MTGKISRSESIRQGAYISVDLLEQKRLLVGCEQKWAIDLGTGMTYIGLGATALIESQHPQSTSGKTFLGRFLLKILNPEKEYWKREEL